MDDLFNDADHPLNRDSLSSKKKSAPGEDTMRNTLQNCLDISKRESKVFLGKLKIINDIKNVVDSESALILGNMNDKYLNNLYQLGQEEEFRKTHQRNMSFDSEAEKVKK